MRTKDRMIARLLRAGLLLTLTLLLPAAPALAHFGQYGGNPCTNCHTPEAGGTFWVAVDGVDETADLTVSATPGQVLEIDYYFSGVRGTNDSAVGVEAELPDNTWIVSQGTNNTPALPAWNATWNLANAQNGGVITPFNAPSDNAFTVEWASGPYDAGNSDVATDDGSEPDGVADRHGIDFRVQVPAGANGPYSIVLRGIGHTGNPRTSKFVTLTVNVSAGSNNPPSLTVSQPDGVGDTVTQGASFNLTYDLSDAEDAATVSFYYDTDNLGADGTAIASCANRPEGTGATCAWDTTAVTPGNYYIYGVATDGTNPAVTVYSGGQVTINAAANNPPSLSISQPDGVGDTVTQGASFNLTYTLADAEDAATVSFYYDVDNLGADGTAIAACANRPEGTGATCAWNTTAITPGSYYVYGVATDGVNGAVTIYSGGQVTINAAANNPPSLSISQPDGVGDAVTVGASFNLVYTLSDVEDVATVSFYYDTDNLGFDGTAIASCANRPEGSGATCAWDTTGLSAGSYYVYGIASDGVNGPVQLYSAGPLTVNPVPNTAPNLPANPSFSQFKSDSSTQIAKGTYTDEGVVVFKATVSDPDGDPVSLQVEIQAVGSAFTGTPSSCTSPSVASGSVATATCSGIADGEYKWQARADDGTDVSGWAGY